MEPSGRNVLGIVIAAAVLLTTAQVLGLIPGVVGAGTELVATRLAGELPVTDPTSASWVGAAPLEVPLSGQTSVTPSNPVPSIDALEVRALVNATHFALRIAWDDETKDNRTTEVGEFRDAVAFQVAPPSQLPNLCMGAAGARMHIMQWKADWQADIEEGFWDLQDAFPNFWVDYYPYAIGEPPYTVPDAFPENASVYLVGYEVGNPFSQPLKVSPVEDAVADGFYTIATQPNQSALGRGVWDAGRWSVVISRLRDTGDPMDTPIAHGDIVAFAVWDGASGDVGARKSVSTWLTLSLGSGFEAQDPILRLAAMTAVALVAAVALVLVWRRMKKPRGGSGGT